MITSVPFIATAYSPCDSGNRTATGTRVHTGEIATDPHVIPLGSWVRINGREYHAEDTGGAIRGHHIDIWMPSCRDAIRWGVQKVYVAFTNHRKQTHCCSSNTATAPSHFRMLFPASLTSARIAATYLNKTAEKPGLRPYGGIANTFSAWLGTLLTTLRNTEYSLLSMT